MVLIMKKNEKMERKRIKYEAPKIFDLGEIADELFGRLCTSPGTGPSSCNPNGENVGR